MKLTKLFRRAVAPRSSIEDISRREFILNILLVASITLLVIAMASSVITSFFSSAESRANNAMPLISLGIVLLPFLSLYALSRFGYSRWSSAVLTTLFFGLSTYFAAHWGPDVTVALLFYSLTIVMSGVLISSRAAVLVALCASVVIPLINHLHLSGVLPLNAYWRTTPLLITDAVVISVILLIIAIVSWLSNREIEKSLSRARRSEAALMEERDQLEKRIQERTEELRMAQLEQLSQAYRFVEFGRLASGLFHDLLNPLTAVSLTLDNLADPRATNDPKALARLAEDIARAKTATAHMQRLMDAMRRHLAREGNREMFSVDAALHDVVATVSTYARHRGVHLLLRTDGPVMTYGDSVAFMQAITNLATNAIESFPEGSADDQNVTITLSTQDGVIRIDIEDTGMGMDHEVLAQIFEPFFTTKEASRGLGLGLPLAKRLIEKEFEGTLEAASTRGSGSRFTIYFPQREL